MNHVKSNIVIVVTYRNRNPKLSATPYHNVGAWRAAHPPALNAAPGEGAAKRCRGGDHNRAAGPEPPRRGVGAP